MSKKGGKHSNQKANLTQGAEHTGQCEQKCGIKHMLDAKVILTTVICFLAGAALVLGMVLFGIEANQRYNAMIQADENAAKSDVIDIISVKYETLSYSYDVDDTALADPTASKQQTLLKKLGCIDDGYCLIKSNSEYQNILSEIKKFGGQLSENDLVLDEDFFNSGSIILVASEMPGLSNFSINSITRDGSYNLYIDTSSIAANDTDDVTGKVMLIKIENIQPKQIELTERTE